MLRSSWMVGVISAGLLLATVGCNDNQEQIVTGPDQRDARIAELERELNDLQTQGAGKDARIRELQDEIARLRGELARKPEPPPAPDWTSVPGGAMTSIEGTLLFDSGKANLKSGAESTLRRVAAVINDKFPDHDVYVFGHTDDQPIRHSGWKDNYELSAQRSLSVVRALRGMGVENKMAAAGWGEQMPVAEGTSPQARQKNRRVEIYAMAPDYSPNGRGGNSPPRGAGREP
jgi:flagellar motor protein MotB